MKIVVKNANSWKRKIIGLIGKDTIEPIYFTTRWGIHTFGVKEVIDVVILDKNDQIVRMKETLTPNRIFLWNPKYHHVVELPHNTIRKNGLGIGSRVSLKIVNS